MNSTQALAIIGAQISTSQTYVDALTIAQQLLTAGYTADQTRIDTAVQAAKDAVAQEVSDLTTNAANLTTALETESQAHIIDNQTKDAELQAEKDAHAGDNTTNEATIATLTQNLADATTASAAKDTTIADLTQKLIDAQTQITQLTPAPVVDIAPTQQVDAPVQ